MLQLDCLECVTHSFGCIAIQRTEGRTIRGMCGAQVENMITRQNRGGAVEASMTTFDQSNPTALLWMVLGNVVWATGKFQELERFCGRMKIMYPKNAHLALLTGHKEMASGAWSQALAEYIVAMKIADCEPMPPLCAAAACLQVRIHFVIDIHSSSLKNSSKTALDLFVHP